MINTTFKDLNEVSAERIKRIKHISRELWKKLLFETPIQYNDPKNRFIADGIRCQKLN